MRNARLQAGAVRALTSDSVALPLGRFAVAPPGATPARSASGQAALGPAVALSTVAVAADTHVGTAMRAQEATVVPGFGRDRQLLPRGAGRPGPGRRYSSGAPLHERVWPLVRGFVQQNGSSQRPSSSWRGPFYPFAGRNAAAARPLGLLAAWGGTRATRFTLGRQNQSQGGGTAIKAWRPSRRLREPDSRGNLPPSTPNLPCRWATALRTLNLFALHQHLGVEGRLLGQVANALLRGAWIALDVYTIDENRPGAGLEVARQHPDQGCFAGSIGTEQTDDLPLTDAKGDVFERHKIAVPLADRLDLDHSLFVSRCVVMVSNSTAPRQANFPARVLKLRPRIPFPKVLICREKRAMF